MKDSTKNLISAQVRFSNTPTTYRPDQIDDIITEIRPFFRFSWSNKKLKYFNVPVSFDIETSSFYYRKKKRAIMYMWSFSIMGKVIIGRTWTEFVKMIDRIAEILETNEVKRLCIYVHNLAYEFQFFRKYFRWFNVFSLDNRKPVYAVTSHGIEFRCSYILSNKSLDNIGKELRLCPVEKLTGTIDYDLIRHSETILTEEEIAYSRNDVLVVTSFILDKIVNDGGIARIPLTNTSYVRRFVKDSCFYEPGESKKGSTKRMKYRELLSRLTLDPEEYVQLKRAFQGGFTHANSLYTNTLMEDVVSFDFSSSYPSVIVSEKFPMSRAEIVEINTREEFDQTLHLYCCLFDIEFVGLRQVIPQESYISRSRCFLCDGAIVNNGRIYSADRIRTTITEQDFFIIEKVYAWDSMRVSNFRRYKRGYLPNDLVRAVLFLYQRKTELKGIDGSEDEYRRIKGMLNSCYGMMVTDIVRPTYEYIDDWIEPEIPDIETEIEKYNRNPGRFLFYPWGVWVTAYARSNLWSGIFAVGNDYVYSDTDSIKILNAEKHLRFIKEYNKRTQRKLIRALDIHGIESDLVSPKNKAGVNKPLGIWEIDGKYHRFKTLGAKRYAYEDDTGYHLTVAGLNKRIAVEYIKDMESGFFNSFSNALYIPGDSTGKMTHTYIDDYISGTVKDYRGRRARYAEESFIHLEKADYSLSISQEYIQFLLGIREYLE